MSWTYHDLNGHGVTVVPVRRASPSSSTVPSGATLPEAVQLDRRGDGAARLHGASVRLSVAYRSGMRPRRKERSPSADRNDRQCLRGLRRSTRRKSRMRLRLGAEAGLSSRRRSARRAAGYLLGGTVVVITIVAGGGAQLGGSELAGGSVEVVDLSGLVVLAGMLAQPTTPHANATTTTILRTIRPTSEVPVDGLVRRCGR